VWGKDLAAELVGGGSAFKNEAESRFISPLAALQASSGSAGPGEGACG